MPDALKAQLQGSTRWGLFGSKKTREAGVTIPTSDGNGLSLRAVDIEQLIVSSDGDSKIDYYGLILELVQGSIALTLNTQQLFKLRAMLLLGVGAARDWEKDTRVRTQAIARTYPRSSAPGYYDALAAIDRGLLIARIAEFLQEEITTLIPPLGQAAEDLDNEPTVRNPEDDPYLTTHYEGTRIEPAPGGELRNSHRRTIRALEDGVSEFRQNMTFAWTGVSLPHHVIVGPGDISVENIRSRPTDGEPGWVYHLVIRFAPLKAGETRSLAWDVVTPVSDDYFRQDPKFKIFGISPRIGWEHARVSVRFQPSRLPAVAERLDGIFRDNDGVPNSGTPDAQVRDYVLVYEWHDLRMGRLYGFRWQWVEGEYQGRSIDAND